MATTIADGLEVCSDCALLIANGTDGHCVDCHGEMVCEETMTRIKAMGNDNYVLSYDEGFEPSFSHRRCDACRTVLSGDRWPAAVFG